MPQLSTPWARAAVTFAALVPIVVGATIGAAAYAVDEPTETPELAVVQEPAEVIAKQVPPVEASVPEQPQPLASTNDPTDPTDPTDPVPPTVTVNYPAEPAEAYLGWHGDPIPVTISAVASAPASIDAIVWSLTGAQTGGGTTNDSSVSFTITVDGETTLEYYAVDSEGYSSDPKTVLFKLDQLAPTGSFTSPTTEGVYRAGEPIDVTFTAVDAYMWIAYVEIVATGERFNTGSTITLDEGVHAVRFFVKDVGGHVLTIDRDITVLPAPDLAAPVVTVTPSEAVPASGWYAKAIEVTFTATDPSPIASLEYRSFYAGEWSAWSVLAAPTGATTLEGYVQFFGSGSYRYEVRATDSEGNVSQPLEYLHKVDKEVVPATITGFRSEVVRDEPYPLSFECTDALSGVATCASSHGASGDALATDTLGDHTFTITTTDVAGNTVSKTWTYTVVEDTALPEVEVTSTANGWTSNAAVDVTIEASDAGSGVAQLWVEASGADGLSGRFVEGSSYVFTATTEGVSTVIAYAIDAAGNRSATVTYTVRIDRTLPTVTITKPANRTDSLVATTAFTQGQVVALEFECTDAASGIESCEATGGVTTLSTATVGDHSIDVVAIDAAGNSAMRTLEYTVVAAPAQQPGQQPAKPGTAQGLASTGVEIWVALVFVAGLLAAGVSFLTVSRVRR